MHPRSIQRNRNTGDVSDLRCVCSLKALWPASVATNGRFNKGALISLLSVPIPRTKIKRKKAINMSGPPPYQQQPYPQQYPAQPGYGYPPQQPQFGYGQPQPNYGGGYNYPPQQPQVVMVERENRNNSNNCCLWALLACCCGCCLAECCD
ncbi:hypothetical protein QR680_003453 [Steinernema hermaphroditum]|uniref:Cysteine-rich transmembrane CYSTM domain-containing protein n=1 Tax=Steinernema hermaphroditum TaxID=289476 RepID=A0AA39H8Q8_9BILA|nr:hypothetical protein QR680_003453 [Steinernema hermaphroditum]